MGTRYSSVSVDGFNAGPPVDDGSATEANKVKWSSIKAKLADPLKTAIESINTKLIAHVNESARTLSESDEVIASDHLRTIEVTTASVTVSLADAATMAAGYIVYVANQSAGNISVGLASASDTIDAVTNATETISPKETRRYIVNAAATGYIGNRRSEFATGTAMLFNQTAAPTGWTKSATHNDKALRVVSGSASSGGATAFTTVFGSAKTTGAKTLATTEIPSHTHTFTYWTQGNGGGGGDFFQDGTGTKTSSSTGGGGSHDHTLSLDLQYVDVIIATKD